MNQDSGPDTTGRLLAWIGEDLARGLAVRVATLLCCVVLVAGLLSESASDAVRVACFVVGPAGLLLLLAAGLGGWGRTARWRVLGGTVLVSSGLLLAVFLGSRG